MLYLEVVYKILKRLVVVLCVAGQQTFCVRWRMSQSCLNLVRFPSTRLMTADYSSILPNDSNVLQQVADVIDQGPGMWF